MLLNVVNGRRGPTGMHANMTSDVNFCQNVARKSLNFGWPTYAGKDKSIP